MSCQRKLSMFAEEIIPSHALVTLSNLFPVNGFIKTNSLVVVDDFQSFNTLNAIEFKGICLVLPLLALSPVTVNVALSKSTLSQRRLNNSPLLRPVLRERTTIGDI